MANKKENISESYYRNMRDRQDEIVQVKGSEAFKAISSKSAELQNVFTSQVTQEFAQSLGELARKPTVKSIDGITDKMKSLVQEVGVVGLNEGQYELVGGIAKNLLKAVKEISLNQTRSNVYELGNMVKSVKKNF